MPDCGHNCGMEILERELKHVNNSLAELKSGVSDLNKTVTDLQIKSASHATIFGLMGGVITAFGSSLLKKFMGVS